MAGVSVTHKLVAFLVCTCFKSSQHLNELSSSKPLSHLAASDTDSSVFPAPFVLVDVLEQEEAAIGPELLPGAQGWRAGGYQASVLAHLSHLVHT